MSANEEARLGLILVEMGSLRQEKLVLTAERDGLERLLGMANRAIGDHNEPDDCFSSGPWTGFPAVNDECPACAYIKARDRYKGNPAGVPAPEVES